MPPLSQDMAKNVYTDTNHSMTHIQSCLFKQRSLNYQNFCAVCESPVLFTKGSRSVVAHYVLNSSPDEVLSDLVAGRPTKDITGSFSVYVMDEDGDLQDVLPSDLHDALYFVAIVERKHGPVKSAFGP